MTQRPSIRRDRTRPAPHVLRDLHDVLDPRFRTGATVVQVAPRISLKARFTAWIRSRAARLMRFGLPRRSPRAQ